MDVADPELLVPREAKQVRDRALDALKLLQGNARIFDVLTRRRILFHLLDQALGRGDGIADFVGDRGRELLHAAGVLALESLPLARELGMDLLLHFLLDEEVAQLRLDEHPPAALERLRTPEDQHDQKDREADDQQRQADHGQPDQLAGDLGLLRGPLMYPTVGSLFGRE